MSGSSDQSPVESVSSTGAMRRRVLWRTLVVALLTAILVTAPTSGAHAYSSFKGMGTKDPYYDLTKLGAGTSPKWADSSVDLKKIAVRPAGPNRIKVVWIVRNLRGPYGDNLLTYKLNLRSGGYSYTAMVWKGNGYLDGCLNTEWGNACGMKVRFLRASGKERIKLFIHRDRFAGGWLHANTGRANASNGSGAWTVRDWASIRKSRHIKKR